MDGTGRRTVWLQHGQIDHRLDFVSHDVIGSRPMVSRIRHCLFREEADTNDGAGESNRAK